MPLSLNQLEVGGSPLPSLAGTGALDEPQSPLPAASQCLVFLSITCLALPALSLWLLVSVFTLEETPS